ncbi:ABC-2 type transport system permease protein [Actinomadura meyerae]|jgi:ABC-2 type transport system permease protein|uniref:ABC-2 type transport system permease protein n=1 Tax=Actinomadura meyerae TaxID=240840 RepID=A0A239D7R8_9ACTN|nr:ABC transporter permease [Actinomadura meyerae]SNS28058.1 ABC-2 type transport system permease protein [Actinomadura meyerae]
MNPTIAMITFRAMLGRKRALLLLGLPLIMLILAVVLRWAGQDDLDVSAGVLQQFGLATLLPLLALIAGTGVIGPEIDDGQIMYVLTKPIPREVIVLTKLVVAIILVTAFATVPTLLAGLVLSGTTAQLTPAFAVGVLIGGVAYSAVFVALAVASRNAVTIGLLYALVWESLLGSFAPGAKSASIQQWCLSITDALTDASPVTSTVDLPVAIGLLVAVTAAGTLLATFRLRTLAVASAD